MASNLPNVPRARGLLRHHGARPLRARRGEGAGAVGGILREAGGDGAAGEAQEEGGGRGVGGVYEDKPGDIDGVAVWGDQQHGDEEDSEK